MAMNLRENKIDKFKTPKKKPLFLLGNNRKAKAKKIAAVPSKKQIQQSKQKKQIEQSKQKKIQQQKQYKTEKWVRKEPKPSLPEDQLDYQQDIEYKKEYSRYIEEHPENVLIKWRGPEFERYPRSRRWYFWLSMIIVAIIIYAILSGGIVMAFVFILIWVVGYLYVNETPRVIDFAITYDGVLVGNDLYKFEDIKSFWIFYEPPHTRIISLRMEGHLRPYLHIPLHQVDPVIVHEKLVEFIEEQKQEPDMIEVIERLLNM